MINMNTNPDGASYGILRKDKCISVVLTVFKNNCKNHNQAEMRDLS
jgi:hypothetical protein